MTPADLRAEADRADAEAERLEKAGRFAKATFDQQAKAQRDTAVEFRKLAEKLEARSTLPLTPEHRHNTLDTVNPAISSNALRSQARMADDVKEHRLVTAMAKKGLTYIDIAEHLEKKLGRKFPRSTVQSWAKGKDDPSRRGIPADAANELRSWLGVPLSAWARVIPG